MKLTRAQFIQVLRTLQQHEHPAHLVLAERTPVTVFAVADALTEAWTEATLSRETLCLLLAQSAFETGHWRSCWNWNLGNAKSSSKWLGLVCQYACGEDFVVDGKRLSVSFIPPQRATSFRAFASLSEGAVDYLTLLQRRFAPAWPAVLSGDAPLFVHAIKQLNYFTGPEEAYAKGVRSLQRTFATKLAAREKGSDVNATQPQPSTKPDPEWAELRRRVAVQQYDWHELLRPTPADEDDAS